jgi:hypothetical protein
VAPAAGVAVSRVGPALAVLVLVALFGTVFALGWPLMP